jgi:hypothetical protein
MEDHDAVFQQLIFSLQIQGMIGLGKIVNPITQKVERNLVMVQSTIETLDALREKTRGNLTEEEQEFLDRMISDLKLNYVDEMKRDQLAKEKNQVKEEKQKKQKESTEKKEGSPSEKEKANSDEASEKTKDQHEEKK